MAGVSMRGAAVRAGEGWRHAARRGGGVRRSDRMVAAVACLVMVWAAFGALSARDAQSASTPIEVTSYTVGPGDTLWGFASAITPQGGDVTQTIEELMELNDLDSSVLTAGQRIVVPVQ